MKFISSVELDGLSVEDMLTTTKFQVHEVSRKLGPLTTQLQSLEESWSEHLAESVRISIGTITGDIYKMWHNYHLIYHHYEYRNIFKKSGSNKMFKSIHGYIDEAKFAAYLANNAYILKIADSADANKKSYNTIRDNIPRIANNLKMISDVYGIIRSTAQFYNVHKKIVYGIQIHEQC